MPFEFARRLHEKMRGEKLRVWFAPEDMQGGQKLIEQIDRAIQVNDLLLLLLSEHSRNSEWVKTEIRKARQAELALGAGLPTPPLGWTARREPENETCAVGQSHVDPEFLVLRAQLATPGWVCQFWLAR